MAGIDRCSRCHGPLCSRCHEPLGEGTRRAIVIVYYPEDPTYPPLRTMPKMLCKKCMDSFFEWKDMGFLDWREIMRSKEAKE